MIKTHVNLTELQKEQLQQMSETWKVPVAQLIREAVDLSG